MGTLVIATNAVVMTGVGLALWWAFRGRFEALEVRMDRHESRIEARVDRLEDRIEQRMDRFEVSLDAARSDLTAVALAVGARPQARGR